MDKQLRNSKAIIHQILAEQPICRNSDSFLELEVLRVYAKHMNMDIERMTVLSLFTFRDKWGFPKPETIRRNRQKLQAKYPELAADGKIAAYRKLNEERVRGYLRDEEYES